MRIVGLIIVLAALSTTPVLAADENSAYVTSVFFTPGEMAKIASPADKPAAASADIHLGAVFYYGPDNWTLWLDNAKWTPATRRADLQVIEVSAEQVRLVLGRADAGRPLLPIVLKPHQTWQAASGKVVEGMR